MQLTAKQVATNILSHTRPGSIILMHSAGGVGQSLQDTVDALPILLQRLRSRGYKLRTVPQLLNIAKDENT